ncbi:hypothetical protein [Aurantimonas endophytica]|uniref:Uncharacterized protein n=1 Tax=Aurantimonas endophytica TaxID=1522175 RepID=A0A7W6MN88_9HYPH|nr:hypothetical protein [Aurantimonas endophytica]MBB4001594.1 hypothetical protein [Aurantimonas endophytica]MCO6402766.1 hypothetical protein [Aurantimonas endophytica]
MANPIKGEIAFDADGTPYKLVFDFNAIVAIEEEFDIKMEDLGEVMGAKASSFRKVFQIGLQRFHDDVTEEEAGDIITAVGTAEASQLITRAFQASFPATEAGNTNARPQKAKGRRTG